MTLDDELFLEDNYDSIKTKKKSKLSKYMESFEEKDDTELEDELFFDAKDDLDSNKQKKKSKLC